MSEIEISITVFICTFAGLMFFVVGEYKRPEQPPTPPKSRSFGNERPPLNERKPPKIERTQSEQDFLWLRFYAQGMENDTLSEDNSQEFKVGYSEAMKDVRWGIDHINEFHKYEELTDE